MDTLPEKRLSKTARFASFEVKREDWNLFKIEDGSLLRAKLVLTGVLLDSTLEEFARQVELGQKPRFGLAFNSNNIFSVEPPPELRGEPDSKKYTIQEFQSAITNEDMDFETLKQSWNMYYIDNGISLKMRLSVVAVSKTCKFDFRGMPVYTIDSNIDVKPELPNHIRELMEKRKKQD
jgi:hypothetical protein